MTRQNPRHAVGGIVALLVILGPLLGGCKEDSKDDAPSSKSSPTSNATASFSDDDIRISAFRDGTRWRVVAFFPKTEDAVAPTTLKVVAGDGSLVGSLKTPRDGDLTETPCSFFFEDPVAPVTFQWTRRNGTRGKRVWRIPR